MQLSRKQVILISVISGIVLLLAVGAAIFLSPKVAEAPEPTPEPSPAPTATPRPTKIPAPTVFLLPLVPRWDTPRPTAEPGGAVGAFVPQTAAPPLEDLEEGMEGPWVGAYDGHIKDILAVGLQEGRTAALLLLRLAGDELTITALPMERTPLPGPTLADQGAQAASLVEAATGCRYGAWMVLDLKCLPAVLAITGPLAAPEAQTLAKPGDALALAKGALSYARRASIWQFPSLKQAIGDGFASNLSIWELWKLLWALRSLGTLRCQTMPLSQ